MTTTIFESAKLEAARGEGLSELTRATRVAQDGAALVASFARRDADACRTIADRILCDLRCMGHNTNTDRNPPSPMTAAIQRMYVADVAHAATAFLVEFTATDAGRWTGPLIDTVTKVCEPLNTLAFAKRVRFGK